MRNTLILAVIYALSLLIGLTFNSCGKDNGRVGFSSFKFKSIQGA